MDKFLQGSRQSAGTGAASKFSSANRTLNATEPVPKTSVCHVGFSLKLLELSLNPVHTTGASDRWVPLRKISEHGWLCTNGLELLAVNFLRLYEVILYSRMANERIISSKPVQNLISLNQKYTKFTVVYCYTILICYKNTFRIDQSEEIWNTLLSLPAEWEDTGTRRIKDPRVVSNGIGIRIVGRRSHCC